MTGLPALWRWPCLGSGRAPLMNGSFTSIRPYYLTYRDYLDVKRDCPSVKTVVPVIRRNDIRAVSDFYQSSGQIFGLAVTAVLFVMLILNAISY